MTVVNLSTVNVKEWVKERNNVYIGRAKGTLLPESKWANPFKIADWGSRETVVKLYKQYLLEDEELLNSLGDLKGKNLGCWCAPNLCHGDILHHLLLLHPANVTMGDDQLTLNSVQTLIQTLLEKSNQQIMKHITEQFTTLNTNINTNRDLIVAAAKTADDAKTLAEKNEKSLNDLNDRMQELEEDKNRHAEQNSLHTIQINVLARRLEDQTNRNSRNSIIIKGDV